MEFMSNVEIVAHALRDYVRPHVDGVSLLYIDDALFAGEPFEALTTAIAIDVSNEVALPPVCIDAVLAVDGYDEIDREFLATALPLLPKWSMVA